MQLKLLDGDKMLQQNKTIGLPITHGALHGEWTEFSGLPLDNVDLILTSLLEITIQNHKMTLTPFKTGLILLLEKLNERVVWGIIESINISFWILKNYDFILSIHIQLVFEKIISKCQPKIIQY